MYLIVGVDPGTTTGIAAVDFRGRVVDLFSSKHMSIDKIIEHLISLGRVSVIASDVQPTPSAVSKLAAQVGAIIDSPTESLSVLEKMKITRPYALSNSHQRDALAAALSTYAKFRNKFNKISSLGYGEEVMHLVIRGQSIDEAIKTFEEKKKKPEKIEKTTAKPEEKKPIQENPEISRLKKQNQLLKDLLEEKESEIKDLTNRLLSERRKYFLEIRRDKEVRNRDRHIINLQSTVSDLRHQLKDFERLREILPKVSEGEIKLIGVFPQKVGGLTLIKKKLKKNDLESLKDIKVAFSSDQHNLRLLDAEGITTGGVDMLWEIVGSYFILSSDLNKIKNKSFSIDKLIEEYRLSRH